MAFPQVQERVTSEEAQSTNTHTVTLPSNIEDGDLLLIFHVNRGGATSFRLPIGWAAFLADNFSGSTHLYGYYKQADGSEGSTVDIETLETTWSVSAAYRITGHADITGNRPQSSALMFPEGYENQININEFRADISSSTLQKETETEDPGTYPLTTTDSEWVASTIAVYPSVSSFPDVQQHTISSEAADTTSHTVELPSNISSGDLLIAVFGASRNNSDDITWPTGWTQFAFEGTPSSGNSRIAAAYREADGSEGSTITVTTGTSSESTHVVYRIIGAASPGTTPPEANTASGTSSPADPPSLTPSGGSDKYLWIAATVAEREIALKDTLGTSTTPDPPSFSPANESKDFLWFAVAAIKANSSVTGTPSSYSNLQHGDVFETALAVMERENNTDTENPGAYTFGSSADWVAATVAIYPALPSGDVSIKFSF